MLGGSEEKGTEASVVILATRGLAVEPGNAGLQTKQDGARLIDAIRAKTDKGEIYSVRFLTCRFQR